MVMVRQVGPLGPSGRRIAARGLRLGVGAACLSGRRRCTGYPLGAGLARQVLTLCVVWEELQSMTHSRWGRAPWLGLMLIAACGGVDASDARNGLGAGAGANGGSKGGRIRGHRRFGAVQQL